MATVLVTGASGFIGRACLPLLDDAGYEVVAVARTVPAWAAAGSIWREADLLQPGTATTLIASVQPTHVLHLAWNATPGQFWTSRDNVRWVQASLDLLEACVGRGVGRIVAAGTMAEYGTKGGTCDETATPCVPDTLYGVCKDALRRIWLDGAERAGVSAAWGRIFHPYGPHEHPAKLVPSVIRALLAGETVATTDGRQQRDFLHVADVAAAFVALMGSDLKGAVNVVSGQPASLRTVIETISARIGRPELVQLGARLRAAGDPEILAGIAGRLHAETSWRPQHSLDSGLADTIAWWRQAMEADHAAT
jgi:nucleoside-diphosphate-sugar epimerase